jgi:hypothetical protein
MLILYIGAHVISRTEGMRAAVADKISNGTRQPVSLGKCAMTPLLGLHLQGLGFEGVEMPDVKMSFNWLAFLSKKDPFVKQLRLHGLQIQFKRVPVSGTSDSIQTRSCLRQLGAARSAWRQFPARLRIGVESGSNGCRPSTISRLCHQ